MGRRRPERLQPRTSAARKSADRTAQEVQNTGKKADRSQRSKKQEIQAQENTGTVRAKACPSLHFCWCSYWAPAPVWAGGYYLWGWERPYTVDLKAVEVPDYVEQDFIRKNIFSRPDVGRQKVDKIVIHYVANPGSTAKNNRDYFDSLADQDPQKRFVCQQPFCGGAGR